MGGVEVGDVADIVPEPATHGVGIGVNEKNAEGGRGDGIDQGRMMN